MKKLFCILILASLFICTGYRKPYKYTIDAEKNAFQHNNIGLNYLKEKVYYAAIEEFKIAITLSQNAQSTAVYKTNLGNTYMIIGYPDMARTCYEDALKMYGLNFQYYINLAKCYDQLHIVQSKIKEYKASNSLYDKIMLGLLYIQIGEKRRGVIVLDDLCLSEPDLLITNAIKQYLTEITKEL